jgi:hypothetical protein
MRVSSQLSRAFGEEFETVLSDFLLQEKLIDQASDLRSRRFLSRSIVPHVQALSQRFNRIDPNKIQGKAATQIADQQAGLDAYWKQSSNPKNLRLAYFLYFMPSNLYRVAAIWGELYRLGFRWPSASNSSGTRESEFRAIEWGAGPASGACGIGAAEAITPLGIPKNVQWSLIEQDRQSLELGRAWSESYFSSLGLDSWSSQSFHRKVDWTKPLLPQGAGQFDLWLMSFVLNESQQTPEELAQSLLGCWRHHLKPGALIVLSEPALKLQSRKLLELRKSLVREFEKSGEYQILLPCMGHQTCGALEAPDDWCHEEVTWWRPPYYRVIDELAHLDRKTLPMSYLIIQKKGAAASGMTSSLTSALPALEGSTPERRYRLVSPAHWEGNDQEFFICGQEGKRRARLKFEDQLSRGDILQNADIRGDSRASRLESLDIIYGEEGFE